MVIVKVKDRYHIKKKDGTPGKTSFASKKSALKAQANLNKFKAKTTKKKTTKKKTTKQKTTKKKKGSHKMAKTRSLLGYARLALYAITIAAPAVSAIAEKGFTAEAAKTISARYTGAGPNGFDLHLLKNTYTPPAIWATIDIIASKAGVYKRIGGL